MGSTNGIATTIQLVYFDGEKVVVPGGAAIEPDISQVATGAGGQLKVGNSGQTVVASVHEAAFETGVEVILNDSNLTGRQRRLSCVVVHQVI